MHVSFVVQRFARTQRPQSFDEVVRDDQLVSGPELEQTSHRSKLVIATPTCQLLCVKMWVLFDPCGVTQCGLMSGVWEVSENSFVLLSLKARTERRS